MLDKIYWFFETIIPLTDTIYTAIGGQRYEITFTAWLGRVTKIHIEEV